MKEENSVKYSSELSWDMLKEQSQQMGKLVELVELYDDLLRATTPDLLDSQAPLAKSIRKLRKELGLK